ncbi:MAG: Vitamin B12 transporter BtuB [Candidatus Brocadia fulgida]|jgi:Outer membrane receptor proteins, mostly Fe transport|uniref:Vitamin B12 transporter BtuB n=1 Tax=Candidatus Brocadia fulgida TaxID=380242 RepID=A0A0M2UXS0_9BACT|nr:MAG: Vitamin B12 transporter BtuB [Candidatus Brocadia fulgida]
MQMKYLFVMFVIILAPDFCCKTALAGETTETASTRRRSEETEAASNEAILKQSAGQGITEEQAETSSPTANEADANSFNQSEESGNNTDDSPGIIQESTEAMDSSSDAILLPEVLVSGRADSLLGIAGTASQGTRGKDELEWRTFSRPGEVLETVPGVIVTQHSGAGKANQFFLRGFNLDHGTDFATSVNGVPVNLPTHGHGQGYTDLNFIIPELIERVDFRKGVYFADLGDFSSTGAADIHYVDFLPQSIAQVEGGSLGYARGLYAGSHLAGRGNLLYAVELFHNDGPWTEPDDYKRINGVLRYSQGTPEWGYSITSMSYAGDWNATDQIARRALDVVPGFGRFDSLGSNDGGDSQRHSLSAEWHRADADSSTKALLYGFYYDLDLFSNFTYFLDSPQGDQFEQIDRRWVGGTKVSHTWYSEVFNRDMENTVGLQIRSDSITNGLFQTVERRRTDKVDYDGKTISDTTRKDDVWETSLSPYVENKIQWADKFRTVFGLRMDYYHFDVNSDLSANSGTRDDAIVSPKGSLVFGPWAKTEYYLSGGFGFHSNSGNGVTQQVDPKTGDAVESADPLVRTKGAEIGVRTTIVKGLQSTLALWLLDMDSELVFSGDAGSTEASAPTRRYGVEWTNYYTPAQWLSLDADFSFSHAEFSETVEGEGVQGRHIPGAIDSVISTGIAFHQPGERGLFSELRLRFFGPRPLTEDNSIRSGSTRLLSAKAGYNFNKNWTLSVEGFNLLNNEDHEIDYYYPSRLKDEGASHNDIHFKPVEPIAVRAALAFRF